MSNEAVALPQRAALSTQYSALSTVWTFVRRYPLGGAGAAVVIVLVLAALLAPVLAPYDPLATSWGAIRKAPSVEHSHRRLW